MNDVPHDEEEDILNVAPTESNGSTDVEDTTAVGEVAAVDDGDDDDNVAPTTAPTFDEEPDASISNEVVYPEDKIDLRGETVESLALLMQASESEIGAEALDSRTKMTGSWENLIFRSLDQPNFEEMRIQNAIATLTGGDGKSLKDRLIDDATKKTLLKTSSLLQKPAPGETKMLTGDAALVAFECQEAGGGYRIPLYNSGITIDVMVPTGNNIQTLLFNCAAFDRDLGTSSGAHYFAYADLVYKTQIVNFIMPLIIGSSYVDWRKNGALASVIKLPDLAAIVMTLAALCYKDGYEGFVTRCTRPKSEEHPTPCRHTEEIVANLFKLVVTRFSAMSKDSIDFMVSARVGNANHSLAQIAKYQAGLSLEGERISFGNVTFVMRIPTITEHLSAGSKFISDIINEIEGDNNEGRFDQFGLRYVRTFLPWIAMVEKKHDNGGVVQTQDSRQIIRELEKLERNDDEYTVRQTLRSYVDKVQLTYVGYPATPCPSCGYTADTPSGLLTFDPFSTFFTLALLSTKRTSSTTKIG